MVSVDVLFVNDQLITVALLPGTKVSWLLTVSYASPMERWRRELWSYLKTFGTTISFSWLLVWDFYQVLTKNDKQGGGYRCFKKANQLWDMIETCSLIDLGFSDPVFT